MAMGMQLEQRAPGALVAHPKNYRRHPEEQLRVLRDSIRIHGQQRPVVIMPDGTILAGHGFVEAAILEGWPEVSCTVYTGGHPEAFIAIDNRSSQLGYDDYEALDALLASAFTGGASVEAIGYERAAIDAAMDMLRVGDPDDGGGPGTGRRRTGAGGGAGAGVDDDGDGTDIFGKSRAGMYQPIARLDLLEEVFPTDNDYDIPLLDPLMQAEEVSTPVRKWGTLPRHSCKLYDGTWHFYTDDYKFMGAMKDPTAVVNTEARNCVEPNITTTVSTSMAEGIYSTFRKRWIARFLQKHGIRIFVDLNVHRRFYEVNFMGVPKGWRAFCTRGYGGTPEQLESLQLEYDLAKMWAGDALLFWVYGGGKGVRGWCAERNIVHVDEHMLTAAVRSKFGIGDEEAPEALTAADLVNRPRKEDDHVLGNEEAVEQEAVGQQEAAEAVKPRRRRKA